MPNWMHGGGPSGAAGASAHPTEAPMWKLVIEDDEGKRTIVQLTRAEYTIGRREGNVVRLTERNVSRQHARLYRKSDRKGEAARVVADGEAAEGNAPTFLLEDPTPFPGAFLNRPPSPP